MYEYILFFSPQYNQQIYRHSLDQNCIKSNTLLE